jgi:hypothetical protein
MRANFVLSLCHAHDSVEMVAVLGFADGRADVTIEGNEAGR